MHVDNYTFDNRCKEMLTAAQLMMAVSENVPITEQFPWIFAGIHLQSRIHTSYQDMDIILPHH